MQNKTMFLLILVITFIISGCSQTENQATNKQNKEQNLNVAFSGQPPSLDPHITTATEALEIARNIFETLVTLNENYEPVPMLAESVESSEDGKVYTFHLREGVNFHNGEEMTSEDVVASMNRWLEKASVAITFLPGATFEAEGLHTVVLKLEEPATDVLDIMAGRSQFPAIMPKDIIDSAPAEGVSEIVGTGPFELKEWKQDQHIHLKKFDNYSMLDEEPSGLAGRKEVFFDNVYFKVVSDSSTRLAGLETGEYDVAIQIPHNNFEKVNNLPNVNVYLDYSGTNNVYYNRKEGPMANEKMRQAVNIALDLDEIMLAAFADEELYEVDHNYMKPDQINWNGESGKESFNQKDTERAKELLEEAEYNGEELILLTSRTYDYQYNSSVVLKEQLEQIGVNIKLEDYDWTGYQDRRNDLSKWDLVSVGGQGLLTTPSQLLALDSAFASGSDHPKITELLKLIRTAETQDKAREHWDELQGFLWNEYVPITIYGHQNSIVGTTSKLEDLSVLQGPIFWNTRMAE